MRKRRGIVRARLGQGCHVLEKSWIFFAVLESSWKSLNFVYKSWKIFGKFSRDLPGQNAIFFMITGAL